MRGVGEGGFDHIVWVPLNNQGSTIRYSTP